METIEITTFDTLLEPCAEYLSQESEDIDKKADSKKLFFANFFSIIVFAYVGRIKTLKLLITELKTNTAASALGLMPIAYNTLLDGFHRFSCKDFERLFSHVLKNFKWRGVPELEEMGVFQLIDGSLFPTLSGIHWAKYKSKKNAIKLHLSFNLNQMIPTEFLADCGNSCERSFLKDILQESITYIADRGYFSFKILKQITGALAFFVIRSKSNLIYTCVKSLEITSTLPACFTQVSDAHAIMTNDPYQQEVRIINFNVEGSNFVIVSNRFDLTTLQLILLYAYRWQIELLFKFIKRSLGGIHLFNNSKNGVTIQFYILMIVTLLQLRLKQECISNVENHQEDADQVELQDNKTESNEDSVINDNSFNKSMLETNVEKYIEQDQQKEEEQYKFFGKPILKPDVWIRNANRIFEKYWKISCHWLCKLKNFLALPFTEQIVKELAT